MLRKVLLLALIVAGVTAATAVHAALLPPGSEDEGSEELNLLRGREQWWHC